MKNILDHRRTLIPFIASKINAQSYLEIGVKGGKTFLPIRVRHKYAVDPKFKLSKKYKFKQTLKYLPNLFNEYFECTSDYFFTNHADKVFSNKLDLVFLDGLHTSQQTYKDFENTLPYLNKNAIIIIHDCSPKSQAAAFPANSIEEVKRINPKGFNGLWSGDVWKVIPLIRSNYPDLNIFVIDNDSGIGIISRANFFDYSMPLFNHKSSEISIWDYNYLEKNRDRLLNIISDEKLFKTCQLFTDKLKP